MIVLIMVKLIVSFVYAIILSALQMFIYSAIADVILRWLKINKSITLFLMNVRGVNHDPM